MAVTDLIAGAMGATPIGAAAGMMGGMSGGTATPATSSSGLTQDFGGISGGSFVGGGGGLNITTIAIIGGVGLIALFILMRR